MPDRITLHGIQFFGYHGAYEEERRLGQRFLVDVELEVDATVPARADDLALTVDYGKAHDIVLEIGTQHRFKLLETLAVRIATAIVERLRVGRVTVRVTKTSAPLPGLQGGVTIEVTRP